MATVVAVTEKLSLAYSEKPGSSQFKLNVKKLNKKAGEYLRVSIDGFDAKDIDRVSDVIAECSKHGLDSTRSWSTLISYMAGLLERRIEELNMYNGSEEKKNMAWKLLKMSETLSEYFTSRTKRTEFVDDGVRLVEIFERCWK